MVTLNKWGNFPGCDFGTTDDDLKEMIKKGEIDPNCTSLEDGQTILIRSIQFRNVDMVRLLLEYGADPDKKSSDTGNLLAAYLPITISLNTNEIEILCLLLDFSADSNIKDRYGNSFKTYFEDLKKSRMTDDQVKNIDSYLYPGINIKPSSKS